MLADKSLETQVECVEVPLVYVCCLALPTVSPVQARVFDQTYRLRRLHLFVRTLPAGRFLRAFTAAFSTCCCLRPRSNCPFLLAGRYMI